MTVQVIEEADAAAWADVATVRAAQAGDDAALAGLLAQHLPLVRAVVARALRADGDLGALDDVVQEVMVRVVANLSTLRDPSAMRSWLIAITVRQVRDRRRGQRVAARRLVPLDDAADLQDRGQDPVDAGEVRWALARQRREMVQAVGLLPDVDREVLLWWGRERRQLLDRTELAQRLGISTGHAAVRVLRARKRLEEARIVARCAQRAACPDLTSLLLDRSPSLLARARRHVLACTCCVQVDDDGFVPAELLLAARAVEAALRGVVRPSAHAEAGHPGRGERRRVVELDPRQGERL